MLRGGSFLSPRSQLEFSLSLWTKEEKTKRQLSVIRAYRGVGGRGCEGDEKGDGEEKEEGEEKAPVARGREA